MNLFKRLFSAAAALALVGAVASCSSEQTLTAYGIVHGEYVGEATVVVNGDKIVSVVFDEAFLPSAWAATKGSTDATNVLTLTAGEVSSQWAKYVNINGVVWTASEYSKEERATDKVSTRAALAVKYTLPGETNHLLNYLKREDYARAYFEVIKNDKFFASDISGNELTNFTYTNTYGKFKSEGKYWAQSATVALGWKGNMEAFQTALVTNGFGVNPAKAGDAKVVSFGDAVTSVTMTDFLQYYELAKLAYNKK
jgi:uncharacterized lipoprotein YehR (DUF1307 family)